MALESGSYIADLVITNPTGSDNRRQGDDHLRLIKKVLTQSFPNIDAEVSATPDDLNLTADPTNWIPEGAIMMWAGSIANIPSGWALCNGTGTTSTAGIAIPDLRNKFILGADADAGGTDDVGDTGGSRDTATNTTDGHALTIAEMPSHSHTSDMRSNAQSGSNDPARIGMGNTNGSTGVWTDDAVGGGGAHTHDISAVAEGRMPPYYALAYIIKL